MERIDHIIVGQGLAGTVLAFMLMRAGKKIVVIDQPALSSCSRIAAGNSNPVVFRRLTKGWKVDEAVPFAKVFYREAESFLGEEFFSEKEILKIFTEVSEKVFWEKRRQKMPEYLSETSMLPGENGFNHGTGSGYVRHSTNLSARKFIEAFRKFFQTNKMLMEEVFDHSFLQFSKAVNYKGAAAKNIIFCEGWKAIDNPLFKWLPFSPVKGELLTVRIKGLQTGKIVHKGITLTPIGQELFLCGSTFEWEGLNEVPTANKRSELESKLRSLVKRPFEVIDQKAGVRPSTQDRRPFIGLHPDKKQAGIFNGFGTKAVLLAPLLAKNFCDFLDGSAQIAPEADISRFI